MLEISLFILLSPPSLAAQTTPLLVLGKYCKTGKPCPTIPYQLVLSSFDQYQTWNAIEVSTGFWGASKQLNNSVCNENGCLVVGYKQKNKTFVPYIAKSNASLTSWSESKISGLPDDAEGQISDIHCAGTYCIAGGLYDIPANSLLTLPILVESSDGGIHWSSVVPPVNDLKYFEYNFLSCGSDFCTAIGSYMKTVLGDTLPIFFTNGNESHTWNKVMTVNGTPFDFRNADYELKSLSCSGNYCVAIGNYLVDHGVSRHTLEITSSDRAQTWNFTPALSKALGDQMKNLSNVSCVNNTCIVAANYADNQPMKIAVSHDNGVSWNVSYSGEIKSDVPLTINCNQNNTCLLPFNNIRNLDMLLSEDGGDSWQYIPNLVNHPIDAIWVNSANCNDNNCIIIGMYTTFAPFILLSKDYGMTWSLDDKITNLPSHMMDIELHAISNIMEY